MRKGQAGNGRKTTTRSGPPCGPPALHRTCPYRLLYVNYNTFQDWNKESTTVAEDFFSSHKPEESSLKFISNIVERPCRATFTMWVQNDLRWDRYSNILSYNAKGAAQIIPHDKGNGILKKRTLFATNASIPTERKVCLFKISGATTPVYSY